MSKEEIEKAKDNLRFFNEGEYITKEMDRSSKVLEKYISQLENKIESKEMVHQYDMKMIDEVKGKSVKLYKMIDEMAKQLAGIAIWNIEKDEPIILKDKEEVKQYFEEKAEES